MSLIFLESFGQYPTGVHTEASGDLMGQFWGSQEGDWTITNLATGRAKITLTNGSANPSYLSGNIPGGGVTTICFGFRLHYDLSESDAYIEIARFYDATAIMGLLGFNGITGQVYYSGGSALTSSVRLTSIGATAPGTSDYWEVKIIFGQSTNGSVYLYKNGVLDNSVTGVDTISSALASACDVFQLCLAYGTDHSEIAFSDLYIDDATIHGDMNVTYEPCDTAGAASDWTPLASTNQSQVDEYSMDEDTSYNRSTVSTDKDSLGCGASTELHTVKGVMALACVKKEDANAAAVKLGLLHSGTEEQSGDLSVTTDYKWVHYVQEDVPGGSGWTEGQVEAAEVSIENVAV